MGKMKYIRDGRSPIPNDERVSRVMSANKRNGTLPELAMRRVLWRNGFRGYRLNYKDLPGKPDICIIKHKLSIFVHGCFWHRCPKCHPSMPRTNKDFWQRKFDRNKERDAGNLMKLQGLGWKSLVVWECELNTGDDLSLVNRINSLISDEA